MTTNDIAIAAELVSRSGLLIIAAGAGMSVDSGLPDYRGNGGFWKDYAPYRNNPHLFRMISNSRNYATDPAFIWGFYGHLTELFAAATPHEGYHIIHRWATQRRDCFALTSNVDEYFCRTGLAASRIMEVYGSLGWLQCSHPCSPDIWRYDPAETVIDRPTMRAVSWPRCPRCGASARPNVLLMSDLEWLSSRRQQQAAQFDDFLRASRYRRGVVLEIGAGTTIATIRDMAEDLARQYDMPLVRINPDDAAVVSPGVGLKARALEALRAIDAAME